MNLSLYFTSATLKLVSRGLLAPANFLIDVMRGTPSFCNQTVRHLVQVLKPRNASNPSSAGVTVMATADAWSATISDVLFGDVWVCGKWTKKCVRV